jgi:hypothetical protein
LEYGGECEKLLIVPTLSEQELERAGHSSLEHRLWRPEGELLVIAAPYREGIHWATTPAQFIPIISELEKLHKAGFVHGDIRGFNTVFTDAENHGWLIDFDFGGKEHGADTVYPEGYNQNLSDGSRVGRGGEKIEKWHDFYALGKLFFSYHVFSAVADKDLRSRRSDAAEEWMNIETMPTPEKIADLKNLFLDLDRNGCTVKPSAGFKQVLDDIKGGSAQTQPAATGSPPQKMRDVP